MFSKLPELCYVCIFNNKVEIISENNILVINTEKICDIIIFNSYIVIFVITNLCIIIYFYIIFRVWIMFYFCKTESEKETETNDTAFKNFLVIQFNNKYLI